MGKSLLTIEKEIIRKEYQKSPLGIAEKKLRTFYDGLIIKKEVLAEDIAKRVYDIRVENEKRTEEYIETRLKLDREAVDNFLLESMTKELDILYGQIRTEI